MRATCTLGHAYMLIESEIGKCLNQSLRFISNYILFLMDLDWKGLR